MEISRTLRTFELQKNFLQSKLSQGQEVTIPVPGASREVELRNNDIFISNAPLNVDLSYHRYVVRSALDKVTLAPLEAPSGKELAVA